MLLNLDYLALFLTEAITMLKTLVVSLDMKLMALGLDPTTILMRGPTLVVLGLALSAVAYLLRGMKCYAATLFGLTVAQRQPSASG